MEKNVDALNIEFYRHKLTEEADLPRRQMITRLLADEKAKLVVVEAKATTNHKSGPAAAQFKHGKHSPIVKRSIVINSRKTSVSLENEFWVALREIAKKEYVAINTLVARIDGTRGGHNLSSAIRIYVLSCFRRAYE